MNFVFIYRDCITHTQCIYANASCVFIIGRLQHILVCRLHYINILKQEFYGKKAYEETSIDEKSVVHCHSNEIPYKFAADVKERNDRHPTMYWLPKLY